LMVCGTAYFGWLIISGFRRGVMDWPYAGLELKGRREDKPLRFWAVTGARTLFSAVSREKGGRGGREISGSAIMSDPSC
jgi:hypothetical protein